MSPLQARRSRPAMTLIVMAIVTYTFWIWQPFRPLIDDEPWVNITHSDAQVTDKIVPLEAHIMSKCPDAKDALELLVLPVMQRVHDKVNFTLSYIGRYVHTQRHPSYRD
jgi:hypothetical protein